MSGMMATVPKFSLLYAWYGQKMLYGGFALLLLAILLNDLFYGWNLMDLALVIWAFASIKTSNNYTMAIFLLMALGARNLEKDYIVRVWLCCVGPEILVSMIVYPILLARGSAYAQISSIGRMYFMFNHYNGFGMCFTFSLIAFIYLTYRKIPYWISNVLLTGGAFFLYKYPNCKSGAVVLIAMAVCLLCYRYWEKGWRYLAMLIPVFTLLTAGICTYIYYAGILTIDQSIIQSTFSMRFQEAAIGLTLCSPTLFGQPILYAGQTWTLYGVERAGVSADLAYVTLFIYYGIIGGIVFLALFYKTIIEKLQQKKGLILVLLAMVCIYALQEWPAFYITIAFPLFWVSDAMDWKKRIKLFGREAQA
jgi:hypothetical protein